MMLRTPGSACTRGRKNPSAYLLGVAAVILALSSPAAAELSGEEETALRLACGEAENTIQRLCLERELGELAAVPRPSGLASLSRTERQRLDAKCSKVRGYGPAELRRCEAVELSRADAAPLDRKPTPVPERRPALVRQPEAGPQLAVGELAELQRLLHDRGYYRSAVDGRYGRLTEKAVRAFEAAQGRQPTGQASASLLAELRSQRQVASAKAQPEAAPLPRGGQSAPAEGVGATQSPPAAAPTLVTAASSRAVTLATSVHAVAVAPATSAEATAVGILDGVAIVLDGDTLEVAGVPVRLYGIDAPESSQMCVANERRYQCGRQAAFELADRIAGQSVSCVRQASDEPGMIVAVCSLEDERLNAWMVREGWALADPGHPDDYAAEEATARAERKGMWLGEFTSPWEWRERSRVKQANQSS
jgi:endonuclease YncB( thermonuclease family)